MRVLMIGDIVGRPGREVVKTLLPGLRRERDLDLVIANGENASGGFGINYKNAQELYNGGGDVITNEELFRLDCDVLIPAAIGGVITLELAEELTAKILLEGAYGPTMSDAEPILNARVMLVVPCVLPNTG